MENASPPERPRRARAIDAALAVALSLGALALMVATLGDHGMAWDEGFTVEREQRLAEWFARVAGDRSPRARAWTPSLTKLQTRDDYLERAGASAGSPWSRESLHYYWQFAREEPNGHPPFYALIGLAGWRLTRDVLPPPQCYRVGPAALFSLTIGALYALLAGPYGRLPALLGSASLLAMPRVFAHAHLASYDAPTLCFWVLAAAAFSAAQGGGWRFLSGWTLLFGLAWGGGMATKLTGWFIPVPLVAWAIRYRDRRALVAIAQAAVVAALVVYATNPTWWPDPIGGVRAFLRSNLTRHRLLPIPTVYFGRLYLFSLPPSNTVVWTAVTVPPLTLLLGLAGIGRVVAGRVRDRTGTLLLLCWAFLMVLKALPNAPGHDGERLFLPAFAFLAGLAGVGAHGVVGLVRSYGGARLARLAAPVLVATTLAAGAWSNWRFHPLQLSYYNALIGGLSGAARAGLEPTYYWDALTPEVRAWINANTPEGHSVAYSFTAVTFQYLHRWGLLRPDPLTSRDALPRWYVVMNRPGHVRYPSRTLARYLMERAKPAKVWAHPSAPEVPLILVYSGEDAGAGLRALEAETKRD
jgi:hypothetical protein